MNVDGFQLALIWSTCWLNHQIVLSQDQFAQLLEADWTSRSDPTRRAVLQLFARHSEGWKLVFRLGQFGFEPTGQLSNLRRNIRFLLDFSVRRRLNLTSRRVHFNGSSALHTKDCWNMEFPKEFCHLDCFRLFGTN